jgi:hypothetical protein
MSAKPERPFADLLSVFRQDSVAGFTVDFFIELGEHAVVDHRHMRRRQQLVTVEPRCNEHYIEGVPLTGRTAGIDQRRCLAVDRRTLAIGVDILVEGIEDLKLA